MKKAKGHIGAHVQFCGHEGWFLADILEVAGACVVHAGGPVSPSTIYRHSMHTVTHHILNFPGPCFWKPEIGVFVVPKAQLRESGEDDQGKALEENAHEKP